MREVNIVLDYSYQLRSTVSALASLLGDEATWPSLACPEEFSSSS